VPFRRDVLPLCRDDKRHTDNLKCSLSLFLREQLMEWRHIQHVQKKEHMSEKRKTRYSEWVLVVSILFWFLLYMFARWRLVCKDRWSDLEKVRWHLRQRKGRCPVCLRKCRVSSSERAKRHEHPVHEQAYGFSPMEMKNKKYN